MDSDTRLFLNSVLQKDVLKTRVFLLINKFQIENPYLGQRIKFISER